MAHDGKLEFLRLNKSIGTDLNDQKVFELLQDEYLVKFGISSEYKKYMELTKQIALIELEHVATDNRFILNKKSALEAKLKKLLSLNESKMSIGRIIQALSKFQGYPVNKYTIPVSEYFDIIENFKASNKQDKTE